MKELKTQFANALLVVLTVAAVISAFLNFQQNFHPEKRFHLPEDGVTWVDRTPQKSGPNRVEALHIVPGSPADNAGLRDGDALLKINGSPIESSIDVIRVLLAKGPWQTVKYAYERKGVEVEAKLIVGERVPDPAVFYQYLVGIAYLGIGLFVYFRRGNAPKALHFLVLCMVSFVLSTFHYTGKLNNFDRVIYWGNVAAGLFAPTIFLHFCLSFPQPRGWFRKRGSAQLLYMPALALLLAQVGFATGHLRVDISPIELRWILDRIQLGFLSGMYLMGALALTIEHRRTDDVVMRQQLKWLRNGAVLAILPFTALYVAPYLLGAAPGGYMRLAVLFLPLIPLTWAYAIIRYRLMDVDVIFQQGYVYTLATLAILGVFYSLFLMIGRFEDLSATAIIALILVATFVFQPIRSWIQEQMDRYYFYKDRYDYRRTLVEFARELSSETDLDKMLDAVADRLVRTLSIRHVAFFLSDENSGQFRLTKMAGREAPYEYLDLSFLPPLPTVPYLFFERTRHAFDVVSRDLPVSVRNTIGDLDLTYYLPCSVRGKTIAWLGVSRTGKGDFLSSDDVELLVTMSGYVGIAIENARLYSSLERKAAEYERLKEYSENIVESINVGILAVDLEDRVESWNTQMEALTGVARQIAVGRCLSELFPADLVQKFDEVRGESGIHHIDKFAYDPVPRRSGAGQNEVTVNIAIAPLVSKEMEQIGRIVLFDDITERSELERRLVQADKLSSIGLLAAGVAHEVNTPLAVISTYAQMLSKQVNGDDQKSKLLEKIARQTFRASEIVNSLLNFSKTSPSAFEEVDLNRVLSDTVNLVGHQLTKAHVEVKLELESSLPVIKGSPNKLQQVFLNLVLNARDAMDAGGVLSVRTWNDGERVNVEVRDTGHGIASEHMPRIYDPFFTTKGSRKGTGLGLSVTYGIVQEHGGTIEVQSQTGAGTLFHLDFPLTRKAVAV